MTSILAQKPAALASCWRAAGRFGFTFEGIFRQRMIVKGRNRDTASVAVLDSEWPARKTAYERWLYQTISIPTAAKDRALGLDAKGRVTMLPSAWIDG